MDEFGLNCRTHVISITYSQPLATKKLEYSIAKVIEAKFVSWHKIIKIIRVSQLVVDRWSSSSNKYELSWKMFKKPLSNALILFWQKIKVSSLKLECHLKSKRLHSISFAAISCLWARTFSFQFNGIISGRVNNSSLLVNQWNRRQTQYFVSTLSCVAISWWHMKSWYCTQ